MFKVAAPYCKPCRTKSSMRMAHRGGYFFLCSKCDQTWSLDGTMNKGTRREPCTSYRDLAVKALQDQGMDAEATLFDLGLTGVMELLEIDPNKAR